MTHIYMTHSRSAPATLNKWGQNENNSRSPRISRAGLQLARDSSASQQCQARPTLPRRGYGPRRLRPARDHLQGGGHIGVRGVGTGVGARTLGVGAWQHNLRLLCACSSKQHLQHAVSG